MKKLTLIFLIGFILWGCGKKDNAQPIPEILAPSKSTLIFPSLNSVCVNGTIISKTKSSITFMWEASKNTDEYEVNLKNLLTDSAIIKKITGNQIELILSTNTPYAWYITSKSLKTGLITKSDTWKFYNAGLGVVAYAPFPAEITYPLHGKTITAINSKINLSWVGSSTDNNIVGYDVYMGNTTPNTLLKSNVKDIFLNDIIVTSGNTYYWKVISKDAKGNSSDSGTYEFTVK